LYHSAKNTLEVATLKSVISLEFIEIYVTCATINNYYIVISSDNHIWTSKLLFLSSEVLPYRPVRKLVEQNISSMIFIDLLENNC